jgi:hypothetical protein
MNDAHKSTPAEQLTISLLREGTVLDVIAGRIDACYRKYGIVPSKVVASNELRAAIIVELVKAGASPMIVNQDVVLIGWADSDSSPYRLVPLAFQKMFEDRCLKLYSKEDLLPLDVL